MSLCGKGLHEMTRANTRLCADGFRRCYECRCLRQEEITRTRRLTHPPHENDLTCRKGLHPWVPENWRAAGRKHPTCAPCARAAWHERYWRNHSSWCIVKGCRRSTVNSKVAGYICPEHRASPPAWIASTRLLIVGASVLAAA